MSLFEDIDDALKIMLDTHGDRSVFDDKRPTTLELRQQARVVARRAMMAVLESFGGLDQSDEYDGYYALKAMLEAHHDERACTEDTAKAAETRASARQKARLYLRAAKDKEFATMENYGVWA